jgi:hypothetical protein
MNRLTLCSIPLLLLAGCGRSPEETANVVQAATKGAAEAGQQLAEKAAEIAHAAPDVARKKAQELLDAAARKLQEVKDSEMARQAALEIEEVLAKLSELKQTLLPKLNLASLQASVQELIERFKSDPRVAGALKSLQEKLNSFAR